MISLQMRMFLLLAVLFGIVYAVVVIIGSAMGVTNFYVYFIFSLGLMFVQYWIGPKMIEWSMRLQYINQADDPKLFQMVEALARRAGLPMPRIAISSVAIPNAFAFGRGVRDGRICVTSGIRGLLNDEELKAVLGHELTHLKNRDVLTVTILSVIPMLMYRIAWNFLFFGRYRYRDNDRNQGNTALIGLAAFLFYFITNLLVLYASRVREYFADQGSVALGNKPSALASALYKLVYGSARMDKETLKEAEGFKAFFINDPSQALNEIQELSQLDMNRNGMIDSSELLALRSKTIQLNFSDRAMELLSTHPNMLKRIKQLSSYGS